MHAHCTLEAWVRPRALVPKCVQEAESTQWGRDWSAAENLECHVGEKSREGEPLPAALSPPSAKKGAALGVMEKNPAPLALYKSRGAGSMHL